MKIYGLGCTIYDLCVRVRAGMAAGVVVDGDKFYTQIKKVEIRVHLCTIFRTSRSQWPAIESDSTIETDAHIANTVAVYGE